MGGSVSLGGLPDKVMDYFVSLIVGVILLYILWEVVLAVSIDIPEIFIYGIVIVVAAAGALVIIAKKGIILSY